MGTKDDPSYWLELLGEERARRGSKGARHSEPAEKQPDVPPPEATVFEIMAAPEEEWHLEAAWKAVAAARAAVQKGFKPGAFFWANQQHPELMAAFEEATQDWNGALRLQNMSGLEDGLARYIEAAGAVVTAFEGRSGWVT